METLAEKAEKALRAVREAPLIGFDVETTGVDWRVNQPVGYVITVSPVDNWYIPVRHGGGGNLNDPNCGPMTKPDDKTTTHSFELELENAFAERRRTRSKLTVGHNLKFDMHMAANQGVYLGRNCEDTQLNEALLNEFARSFSLENCAIRHCVTPKLGTELYFHIASKFAVKPDRSAMSNYWRLAGNDPIATEYALGDGVSTLELRESQHRKISDEGMAQIHAIESRLLWTVFRMERRGIKVDEAYIEDLIRATDAEILNAERALPRGFNPRSSTQVMQLMKSNGHLDWPTTEKGNPSFTEKFLKSNEEGRAIIALRQLSNLKSTFVLPLKDTHVHKGRVHAELHQLKADNFGTVSGRFSCSNPNLQAIHKRNKVLGRQFRKIFVADSGMDFWEADYSQCEPRLFAHYSQEPRLLEGYNSKPPEDMHAVVAKMFNVERDPTAKRMNMGILTGMQPKSFAGHMGWDIQKATEMHQEWFKNFPSIANFQTQAKLAFLHRGYVKTILGRRCRLEDRQYAYRATSRIIQGGNADIIKLKILEADEWLEREGDQAELLMTVHDSINWQAPTGPLGEEMSMTLMKIFCDVRSEPINLRVPFVMDVGHGRNWAEATYGVEEVK